MHIKLSNNTQKINDHNKIENNFSQFVTNKNEFKNMINSYSYFVSFNTDFLNRIYKKNLNKIKSQIFSRISIPQKTYTFTSTLNYNKRYKKLEKNIEDAYFKPEVTKNNEENKQLENFNQKLFRFTEFKSIEKNSIKILNTTNELGIHDQLFNLISHKQINGYSEFINRQNDNYLVDNLYQNIYKTNNITSTMQASNNNKQIVDELKFSNGDYVSNTRIIKFYITTIGECNIFVNDTVKYIQNEGSNLVEHMILHNNANSIEPKGVYSNEVTINFFAFNKKLNIFSVYYDNKFKRLSEIKDKKIKNQISDFKTELLQISEKKLDNYKNTFLKSNSNINEKINNKTSDLVNSKNDEISVSYFSIEYDYEAANLIKSKYTTHELENTNSDILRNKKIKQNGNDSDSNSFKNNFIWKILNQNQIKISEEVKIEIYFDVKTEKIENEIYMNLPFTKSVFYMDLKNETNTNNTFSRNNFRNETEKKKILKYEWNGIIEPQEVLILNVEFPQIFNCEIISVNYFVAFVGSLFIIFLIGMTYILISNLLCENI